MLFSFEQTPDKPIASKTAQRPGLTPQRVVLLVSCQTPVQHHNKLLHDVPAEELECAEPPVAGFAVGAAGRVLYPLLWLCLGLSSFGLLAVGLVHYSRGCLGQWVMKMRHRGTDTVSYTNVVESSNDLVRILPGGETNEHVDI